MELATKPCTCKLCTYWHPLQKRIREQLNDEGKKEFDILTNHLAHVEDDLNYAEAKLDGSWPGWERMKDFKPEPYQVN